MIENWPLIYLTAGALWGATQVVIGLPQADEELAACGEEPVTAWELIKGFAQSMLAWPVELIELVEDMVAPE